MMMKFPGSEYVGLMGVFGFCFGRWAVQEVFVVAVFIMLLIGCFILVYTFGCF